MGHWGQGISRMAEGRISAMNRSAGLAGEQIWALHADREGSIWVGSWNGGLNRLRPRVFAVLGEPEGLGGSGRLFFSCEPAKIISGDDLQEARDFDRGERDLLGPCDASSPCQFGALPRQTNRSHAERWPAFPGDRLHRTPARKSGKTLPTLPSR